MRIPSRMAIGLTQSAFLSRHQPYERFPIEGWTILDFVEIRSGSLQKSSRGTTI